jgi:DNA-directed RNA polymerase subunit beta'
VLTFNNIKAIKISLASPERIRELSYGEVKKPETKNYKTLKPERDGLFCERIFGPEKDYECACGKYKKRKIKAKGVICDRCGVEVTKSKVRRERMGHIELAAPVVHFWFLQGSPGILSILLDLEDKQLKDVVYFESYIVTDLNKNNRNILYFILKKKYINKKDELINLLEEEYKKIINEIKDEKESEFLNKVISLIKKADQFLRELLVFQFDVKKFDKLYKVIIDEDYPNISKRLYAELKRGKIKLNRFIKIFEEIEAIDRKYIEIQKLLTSLEIKSIYKNDDKEILIEAEKYEKEKIAIINLLINPDNEIQNIVNVTKHKLENLLTKFNILDEKIERTITYDINLKLSSLKEKNLDKKIKKENENIINLLSNFRAISEDFNSNIYNYLVSSKVKYNIKDIQKLLKELENIIQKLRDYTNEIEEDNLISRDIQNIDKELIQFKSNLMELHNIFEIFEVFRKVIFELKQSSEKADISKWVNEYVESYNTYWKLAEDYKNLPIKSEKDKETKLELLSSLKELENKLLELYFDDRFKGFVIKLSKVARVIADNIMVVFRLEAGALPIKKLLSKMDLQKELETLEKLKEKDTKNLRKYLKRISIIKMFLKSKVKPEWMVLEVLPVLPAEIRPIVQLEGGKFASSDLNDLYRRIINRNLRLKRLIELQAPLIIINNEKRMLQKAVDALIDNSRTKKPIVVSNRRVLKSLSDSIQGKQGRFRYNLLGKRVDFSGRSVIVVNPKLKMYQCGLPIDMALELFKPFIFQKLIEKGKTDNIRKAKKMIELRKPEIWDVVQNVISNFPVILNRAPTLHRLSIQAFYPVLVDGKSIQVHPLVCGPYNADFDGDQMAVHIPLSVEAQLEYRNLMLSIHNMLIPANGEPANAPSQDMVLGAYWLTFTFNKPQKISIYVSSYEEAIKLYDQLKYPLSTWVYFKVNFDKVANGIDKIEDFKESKIETTIGRIIFSNAIRKYLPDFPFINFTVGKKELKWIVEECIYKYGMSRVHPVLDELKDIGFYFATKSATTISIGELIVPEGKYQIINEAEKKQFILEKAYELGLLSNEEYYKKKIDLWYEVTDNVTQLFKDYFSKNYPLNSIWMLANSGARGNIDQAKQLVAIRGLMVNPKGEVIPLPIKKSFTEGLGIFDYFVGSHGSRKGLVDTALRTADAGYLTRKLVDVSQDVIVREEDCKTQEYITVKAIKNVNFDDTYIEEIETQNSLGKYVAIDYPEVNIKKYDVIDYFKIKELLNKGIKVIKVFNEEEVLPLVNRIRGRVAASDYINLETGELIVAKGDLITRDKAKVIAKYYYEVNIRSVLKCKVFKGVCRKCYGEDMARGNVLIDLGEAVGIIAAQSIGEPGTQLTLRTFHTGGVALEADIIQGIPRVQELLEVRRKPKNACDYYVLEDSIVEEISINPLTNEKILKIKGLLTNKVYTYTIPSNRKIIVKVGQKLEIGSTLTHGTLPFKILLENIVNMNLEEELKQKLIDKAVEKIQKYIINEMQKVYLSQGVFIVDKHMEIIVRQMFRFVYVEDPGDSSLMYGQVVDRNIVNYINSELAKNGKKLVKYIPEILGISKASLESESWLSAASFQETTRVLSYAAIAAKKDHLIGLKENIIIGKLIPVGTNFEDYKDVIMEEENQEITEVLSIN